jgi:hypothetical protein
VSLIAIVIVIGQCLVEVGVFALKKRERDRGDSPRKGRRGRGGVIPLQYKNEGKRQQLLFGDFMLFGNFMPGPI